MTYLAAIFISPLYFAVRGKWGGFAINLVLYVAAWFTLVIFGLGILFWALGVGHAFWELRKEMIAEHADVTARRLAEEMRRERIESGAS